MSKFVAILKIILFWFLSLTWGALLSIPGLITALFLTCLGGKPHRFHHYIWVEYGSGWGGFDLGPVFVTQKNASVSLRQHESGHGFQNILLGPFMLFVVSIPSLTRYWMREMNTVKAMKTFASVEFAVFVIIGAAMIAPAMIFGIWALLIVGAVWTLYAVGQCIWAAGVEASRYGGTVWPDYDDVWFEGNATKTGEAMFPLG